MFQNIYNHFLCYSKGQNADLRCEMSIVVRNCQFKFDIRDAKLRGSMFFYRVPEPKIIKQRWPEIK